MSIYEAFIDFLQKEFGVEKDEKSLRRTTSDLERMYAQAKRSKKLEIPKPKTPKWNVDTMGPEDTQMGRFKPKETRSRSPLSGGFLPKMLKGGQGSGRKAGSGSKLSAPKTGSPIKTAISRYYGKRTPSMHQKIVDAFRSKEGKKATPDTTEAALSSLKHPLD